MAEVFADAQVRGFNPSLVGGTLTAIKVFPSLLGPSFNDGGGASITPAAGTPPASLVIPGSSIYEGKVITVTAAGTVFIHGASQTLNLTLQNGLSLTASSNTTIATGASALSTLTTAAQYPFAFQVKMQGDSQSGIVQLWGATCFVDGTTLGTITLTSLTGVSFVNGTSGKTTLSALNLVFGLTFGVSDALNEGQLMQFTAEA
jgi:hypothetical protein